MKPFHWKNIQSNDLVSNQTLIFDSKFIYSFTNGLNKNDLSSLQKVYTKNALLLNSGVKLSKSGPNMSRLIKKLNDFFLGARYIYIYNII